MNVLKKYIKDWSYVDTRVLALFRIGFGLVGLWDVYRRYYLIDVFYSYEGMNLRKQIISPVAIKYFSLLDTFRTSNEVHFFFAGTMLCFCLCKFTDVHKNKHT